MDNDPNAFGTIFCKSDTWQRASYPHGLFHKCESRYGRGQALHSKIITASIACQEADKNDGEDSASYSDIWWCIGSHNFTPSAWGKFVKEKRSILIANYELGVIIPTSMTEDLFPPSVDSNSTRTTFPYPYIRPPPRYGLDDAPWMQDLLYE